MSNQSVLFGSRVARLACLVPVVLGLLLVAACGGGGAPTTPTSGAKHRAFISNNFSGNLQIVDTQNDTTPLTQQTTNSSGQIVPGQPVTISVALTGVTFEVLSPNRLQTAVYNPTSFLLYLVDNAAETTSGSLPTVSASQMAVFSPDSSKVYVPEPNGMGSGAQHVGLVQVFDTSTLDVTANYVVPSARYVAISPTGQYLLAFAGNSDSVFLIDVNADTQVEVPGFARPINAFFSSDGNTAYVLNCGPECGSSGPASVSAFTLTNKTITATVPVGGASVGLLNGTTLYVAGSPVPPGTTSTFDAVDISNMTRTTTNSVAIGDGFHTTMALAQNNKLYIGANSCNNTTTGCLSVVDVSNNTADPPLPPRGAITSLLAIGGRNTVYALEGGFLHIYDTATNTLQPTQLNFTGALYGIVQVDQ